MNRNSLYVLVFGFLLILGSCAAYKGKKQEAQLIYPELGALAKRSRTMFYKASEQVGMPKWDQLKVTPHKLPFNNESYLTYAKAMQRAGTINTIPYNDSLKYKPKYVRLQLLDKIRMTQLLNEPENKEVMGYLEKDGEIKLVVSIDIAPVEEDIDKLMQADGLLLKPNELGREELVVVSGQEEYGYKLDEFIVFNYTLATFCWGEDRYHNVRIENIVADDQACPKGTYSKPSKVHKNSRGLKF